MFYGPMSLRAPYALFYNATAILQRLAGDSLRLRLCFHSQPGCASAWAIALCQCAFWGGLRAGTPKSRPTTSDDNILLFLYVRRIGSYTKCVYKKLALHLPKSGPVPA